jgi:hypothetical protein
MPLPQQVINQLSHDNENTPGWSSGVLLFSSILLGLVVLIYLFLLLFYGPQLNSSLGSLQSKVATLDQSIASGDETQLVSFYSQVVNLQTVLNNHTSFAQFLDWLQQNTESNISYSQLSLSSGSQISLSGSAPTEADVNQQVAIFESSPEVEKFTISNVAESGVSGAWTFSATLIMNPSVFLVAPISSSTTATSTL